MIVEFRYRFEAAHRFLQSDSKSCMTPHGHSWHASLGLKFVGQKLNSSQMTVEFSEIKKDWKNLIQQTFDHSYMHNIEDPVTKALVAPGLEARLIPFPGDPTTELISVFMFNKMKIILENSAYKQLIEVQSITLEETPTNKVICDQEFYQQEIKNYQKFNGWWNTTNIEDRSFSVR